MQIIFENYILNKREASCSANISHLPLILYYSQKMSAVHRPTYCYFHSQNTKPVMQLLGWNKISPPPLLIFFIHLVLNDLQQKNNKVSKSHFRKFLSTCSQQVNQFFFSVNVSWVTVLLKSLITDSFFLKGPYINKIFVWNLEYHFRFLHGEIGG